MKRKPLELVVLQGGGRGARHSLAAPHVVLGRLDPCESPAFGNLLFPEPTVSRVHATLDWDEGANRYLLTHRSATNPTFINQIKVSKPRHLSPGDKIQMGNLILEIRVGIGQHAEVELETVDFTALTKQAANQVYRPATVMPQPPVMPTAKLQPPQEAPIPDPIPPPARRQLPAPVFHEPYAPVEVATATPKPVASFLEFPEADERVPVVQAPPRRIQLSSLPRRDDPMEKEETPEASANPNPTSVTPQGLSEETKKVPDPLPSESEVAEALDVVPEAAVVPEASEEKPKARPFRRKTRKVGRNEKCPCGSGKKYKKCCGK
ncbi:MAG: FHA domain-containing protein [Candidatus Eremiobacteraeota bacterium]|nr:FHA domain-containing protein [Candidatus Eremiobacteraeota bacterium]MCW5870329.1 FHA domain-containing protein [Candidatus Eremiobacteraeota bacterium]